MALATEPLFILNPKSGTKQMASVLEAIEGWRLRDLQGAPVQIQTTQHPGHAETLARSHAEQGGRLVVAVGGDGTIQEVGRGLLGTACALGILPRGSGNGLARHLGIPLRLSQALKVLTQGHTEGLDCFTINQQPFFNVAGIGFDAEVSHAFARAHRRGLLGYILTSVPLFFRYRPIHLQLTPPLTQKDASFFLLSFANGSQYGNNAHIAPAANHQDGLIDVCALKPFPAHALPGLLLQALSKKERQNKYLHREQRASLNIHSDRPLRLHADGEAWTLGPNVEIRQHPNRLQVVVPCKGSRHS
jgi:YegS/Rv2252/BmrU family lipid kinase